MRALCGSQPIARRRRRPGDIRRDERNIKSALARALTLNLSGRPRKREQHLQHV
jgi:hypothetical protein